VAPGGIYIFVEGDDDRRFFEKVLAQHFTQTYGWMKVIGYASMRPVQVTKFIKGIDASGGKYIFLADKNGSPCVTIRKEKLMERYTSLKAGIIQVVVQEIESWYLAGLDSAVCRKLRVRFLGATNSVPKEEFNTLMPKRYDSRIAWMIDVLGHFSLETAKAQNDSFRYFAKKYSI
jgi:hypothetical protein